MEKIRVHLIGAKDINEVRGGIHMPKWPVLGLQHLHDTPNTKPEQPSSGKQAHAAANGQKCCLRGAGMLWLG